MKSTVEHLNPTRVKLSIEVPFDELKPHFDNAYRSLAGQIKVPGFRPGHIPPKILDARLGRGTILTEVVNEAVPAKYGEAVSAENLRVIGQPEIEITRIEDGESVEFTAEVDVRPEFDLPALGEVAVTVDDVEVTEPEIDEQVDALRDRFATTTAVDRAAADGDLVTIDLRASIAGQDLADATADGLTYRVGSGDLVDGIDEAVTGLSAGESATFTSALVAGEHRGDEAEVTVSVTAVTERSLPAVDDDFAQLASEFDTVAEMRTDLAEKIRRVKNLSQGAQARDKVLEALLTMTEIPIPAGIVEGEIKARQHDAVHVFDHDEAALDAHLSETGQSREQFEAEILTASQDAVRTQLLLDAIAEAEGVGVTQEEFTERLMYNAQRIRMSPDEYFKRLQESNQMASIFAEVRRGKALAGAVQRARVTDTSGTVLDVNALFGIEEVDEADDAQSADNVDAADGGVVDGGAVGSSPDDDGAGHGDNDADDADRANG